MVKYAFMKNFVLSALLVLQVITYAFAQPAERLISREEYIRLYKDEAIKGMLESGVPASITLAQGILESGDGNSPLARYANNHFGIKCHSGWDGPSFIQDDDAKNECFRKYPTVYESYKDHAEFLKNRSRYAFLFEYKTTDYKKWAHGLKQAGYATNPKYPDLLIRIIEENNLHDYDKVNKMPELAIKEEKTEEKHHHDLHKHKSTAIPEIKVSDNNIKFVIAKNGDSYFKIAEENNMGLWQVLKYNDLEKGQQPKAGEVVYLQPKRNKSKVAAHRVKDGETVWDISQMYGVKLDKICENNGVSVNTQLKAGTIIALK